MTSRQNSQRLGVAAVVLKAGQRAAQDLEKVITDNTVPDLVTFGASQYMRIGAGMAAGYAVDEALKSAEQVVVPKAMRGLIPTALYTIGVGVGMSYVSRYVGNEGMDAMDATRQVLEQYGTNIVKLVSFQSDVHAGYLAGGLATIKSTCRFAKSFISAIGDASDKQEIKQKEK